LNLVIVVPRAFGDSAIVADTNAPAMFLLGTGRSAGWQFSVNAPLQLTGLGLYDWNADGFQIAYPLGLWDDKGNLIADVELPFGANDPDPDGFVYLPAEGAPILTPGTTYTIAYFASSLAPEDRVISFNGSHTMNPMINQIGGPVITTNTSGSLSMPDAPFSGFDQWIGPSFQFVVVPAPSGLLALVMFAAMPRRRRHD
jgi:hypothetical protein